MLRAASRSLQRHTKIVYNSDKLMAKRSLIKFSNFVTSLIQPEEEFEKRDLPVWAFREGKWAHFEGHAQTTVVPPDTISFLTWNVWFDDHNFDARVEALAQIMHEKNPDFICLQEVTKEFLEKFCALDWVRQGYFMSHVEPDFLTFYGCIILTRFPVPWFKMVELPGNMGRYLLYTSFEGLCVSTVHLESLERPRTRGQQLDIIFDKMKEFPRAAFMGDFNFCHTWAAEQGKLHKNYTDVWAAFHDVATEPGWTMPPFARWPAWRPDRVMLRGLRARSIEMLGLERLPMYRDAGEGDTDCVMTPSDHRGLFAVASIDR